LKATAQLVTLVALASGVPLAATACKGGCADGAGVAPGASASASVLASTSGAATLPRAADGGPAPQLAASVLAVLNPNGVPAYAGATGSVEGTIYVEGDEAPPAEGKNFAKCPDAVRTRGRVFRSGAPVDGGTRRPLVGALVAITGYSGFFVPEKNEVKSVVIESCEEAPRTITMTFGQRLEVQNKTKAIMAPAVEQAPSPALMLAPPGGDPVKLYVPKPGHFTLVDRMGGDAIEADLYAMLYPLHTVSDRDGRYRIDGVPLGKLTVNTRLAAVGQETSAEVDVLPNVVQRVDLTLRYAGKAAGARPAPSGEPPRKNIH